MVTLYKGSLKVLCSLTLDYTLSHTMFRCMGKIDDKIPQMRVCYLEGVDVDKGLKGCISDSSRILRGF